MTILIIFGLMIYIVSSSVEVIYHTNVVLLVKKCKNESRVFYVAFCSGFSKTYNYLSDTRFGPDLLTVIAGRFFQQNLSIKEDITSCFWLFYVRYRATDVFDFNVKLI